MEKTQNEQAELDKAPAELMQAKIKTFESGEATIAFDSTNLDPELEKIMWRIIERIQIRVGGK